MKSHPFVSFIIPTFNSQRYLDLCLKSIRKQDYPKKRFEILILDGGSTDKTLSLAKKNKAKIIDNPQKSPEIAKSIGIQKSKGEIIALLDSDNEIVKTDWLSKMVQPFVADSSLFGVESFYYPPKGDNIFNTYCMIAHIADPFSRIMASKLIQNEKEDYLEYTIPAHGAYPLGANGFLWSKKIIKRVGKYKPIFEESNFSALTVEKGYRKFARVKGYGIYHYHIDGLFDFIKKRLKIGNKFLNRKVEKKKTWLGGKALFSPRFIFGVIYCITGIGPFIEGIYNFVKTREKAWLIHPLMCFMSVTTYMYVYINRNLLLYGKIRKLY